LIDDPTEVNGFETCLACVNEWKIDFAAPCFVAHRRDSQRIIDTLSLSATTREATTDWNSGRSPDGSLR
jgi:hypothetical protein